MRGGIYQIGRPEARKRAIFTLILSGLVLSAGCTAGKPRMRFGAFFGSPTGIQFPEPANIGKHHYGFALNESVGLVYTCKGGFIDIGHLREAADRTAYLKSLTHQAIIDRETEFSFSVIEPSRYWVKLSYNQNWENLSEQERDLIAEEVSILLAQYFAHTSLIWHEIITWYGFATSGIFSDKISAFSWEDTYSDALGIYIGGQALREQDDYDVVMTRLIYDVLEELDAQPAKTARQAAKSIEGQWYTGGLYFFVNMKRRNFDTGLYDGSVTPWLVPKICSDTEPVSCPVPSIESVSNYGLEVELEIEFRIMEQTKICYSIGLGANSRIKPPIHFAQILSYIEKTENHKTSPELDNYSFGIGVED